MPGDPRITRDPRETPTGHAGAVVWLTGLPAAGKTTIATLVGRRLRLRGCSSTLLDGDELRRGLCADLGFSPADRRENVRRVAEVARLFAAAGHIAVTALVSPYRADRDAARARAAPGRFVEVWVDTPLEVCASRDPKGLYARARAGLLRDLTGVDAPYEPPLAAELVLDGSGAPADRLADEVVAWLEAAGILPRR